MLTNLLYPFIRLIRIQTANKYACFSTLIVVLFGLILTSGPYGTAAAASSSSSSTMMDTQLLGNQSNTGDGIAKRVILNFDDISADQIRSVKPILDKYGFKGTFFPVCGWITSQAGWDQVNALVAAGMDVQSHTMTHPNLNSLSQEQLDNEIGQSKQCLLNHGINATIFAYSYGAGSHNSTVVNTVAKYYDLARSATYCCSDYENKFNDRYSINSWVPVHITGSFNYSSQSCTGECQSYNNQELFGMFKTVVNDQSTNIGIDKVEGIPIIVYHGFVSYDNIQENRNPTDTSITLFDKEMKYLHDEGFQVLLMRDLQYDQKSNSIYITSSG